MRTSDVFSQPCALPFDVAYPTTGPCTVVWYVSSVAGAPFAPCSEPASGPESLLYPVDPIS